MQLTLNGLLDLPSLGPLLDALVPPSTQVAGLRLMSGASIEPGSLVGPACERHLAEVAELHVGRFLSGDAEASLAALLRQSPRLERLVVMGALSGSLPADLLAKGGLRALCLIENSLASLPPGPYLASE